MRQIHNCFGFRLKLINTKSTNKKQSMNSREKQKMFNNLIQLSGVTKWNRENSCQKSSNPMNEYVYFWRQKSDM